MDLDVYIAGMPKVELHVHLEGSIRPSTLLTLARRNGVTLPAEDVEGLRAFYRFTDFDHFLRVYFAISGCLRTPEDFSLIAYEFGHDMARQNVRYAEVTFTPHTSVTNTGLPLEEILEALNDGRTRAQADFGVEMAWILDIVRGMPESQMQVAAWATAAQDQAVVGLGLGGPERGNPPEDYAEAFDMAREAGLHSVPHAGEMAGPESVWGALRVLGAERLGHGVRCIEDPSLVEHLRVQQIPLEVCPSSEVLLGAYPSYEEHPLRWLWEQGLYVTVNSDDPPMFNTNLVGEYQVLARQMGFGSEELANLSLAALAASFLPAERKEELDRAFRAEFAALGVGEQEELL
jgi:adenosine deaminase